MITYYVVLYDCEGSYLHTFVAKAQSEEALKKEMEQVMSSKPWKYYEGATYTYTRAE